MGDNESYSFNEILKEIIKKSSFTERQIEIILNQKNLVKQNFSISKGAYFRQVGQSREKLSAFYYSIILLKGLGVFLQKDVDVISRLADQISVIKDSDVFPERRDEVINVIDRLVHELVRR